MQQQTRGKINIYIDTRPQTTTAATIKPANKQKDKKQAESDIKNKNISQQRQHASHLGICDIIYVCLVCLAIMTA